LPYVCTNELRGLQEATRRLRVDEYRVFDDVHDNQGIDDDDIEDLLLERSQRFWDTIGRARRGKPIAIDALRRQIQRPEVRGKPAGPRGRVPRRPLP
ncbi:MAG: hypothetical protein ACRDGN_15765, partial [bacterium]